MGTGELRQETNQFVMRRGTQSRELPLPHPLETLWVQLRLEGYTGMMLHLSSQRKYTSHC